MSRDQHDALIDQLLREFLGGDRPRDMTARIVAQARLLDRTRRTWWIGSAAAIAASIAIVIGIVGLWPRAYPEARLVGGGLLIDTAELSRGTHAETAEDQSANINIGGYVDLTISPDTALTLGGAKFQERVVLDRGRLDVSVERNKGKFDIAVGTVTIHVTDTTFNIDVTEDVDEEQEVRQKKMQVEVTNGSIEVLGLDKPQTVNAGESRSFLVSSERMVKAAPKTTAEATAVPGMGMAAGMQEGSRTGNRGNAMIPPGIPMNRVNPNRSMAPSVIRPMQVVTGDVKEVRGTLRRYQDVYYLQVFGFSPTMNRTLFLFSWEQLPFPNWEPPKLNTPISVTWINGRISQFTDLSVNRPGFNFQGGRQGAPAATQRGNSSPSPAQIPQ